MIADEQQRELSSLAVDMGVSDWPPATLQDAALTATLSLNPHTKSIPGPHLPTPLARPA